MKYQNKFQSRIEMIIEMTDLLKLKLKYIALISLPFDN